MDNFRNMILTCFKSYPKEKMTEVEAHVDRWMTENYELLVKGFSIDLTDSLDGEHHEFVESIRSDLEGFHGRLQETWYAPLTRLDSLIAMCMEAGDQINSEYRASEKHSPSCRRNMTTRLHTRAVQIANEVSCLLRGGYADGAMARWRSLHETTVILALLARNNETLSIRFRDHQAVSRVKAANEYNEHHAELGFAKVDQIDLDALQAKKDAVLAQYGSNFSNEFGWACEVLNLKRPTFKDIEKHVELAFLRPQYGFASKNVHSGVDSIGYRLALSMSGQDILLAGPSDEGLTEPIQCTSYSLIIATSELIHTAPTDERAIMENVLWRWHDMLKLELVESEEALRVRGESKSN